MQSCQSMYRTETGQLVTGPCFLAGVIVTDGGGASLVDIHDSTSADNAVFRVFVNASSFQAMFPAPIAMKRGVYVTVSGSATVVTVLLT